MCHLVEWYRLFFVWVNNNTEKFSSLFNFILNVIILETRNHSSGMRTVRPLVDQKGSSLHSTPLHRTPLHGPPSLHFLHRTPLHGSPHSWHLPSSPFMETPHHVTPSFMAPPSWHPFSWNPLYGTSLWTEWITDRCKNITFPQTSFAVGKKVSWWIWK